MKLSTTINKFICFGPCDLSWKAAKTQNFLNIKIGEWPWGQHQQNISTQEIQTSKQSKLADRRGSKQKHKGERKLTEKITGQNAANNTVKLSPFHCSCGHSEVAVHVSSSKVSWGCWPEVPITSSLHWTHPFSMRCDSKFCTKFYRILLRLLSRRQSIINLQSMVEISTCCNFTKTGHRKREREKIQDMLGRVPLTFDSLLERKIYLILWLWVSSIEKSVFILAHLYVFTLLRMLCTGKPNMNPNKSRERNIRTFQWKWIVATVSGTQQLALLGTLLCISVPCYSVDLFTRVESYLCVNRHKTNMSSQQPVKNCQQLVYGRVWITDRRKSDFRRKLFLHGIFYPGKKQLRNCSWKRRKISFFFRN